MHLQDQPTPPPPPTPRGPTRAVWTTAIATALLAATLAAIFATRGEDPSAASLPPVPSTPPATAAAPTTTIDPRTEVVARLRQILKVRDKALLSRDASLLDAIYTVDCNCLQDGRTAIRRLRQERVVWKGLSTRLAIQHIEHINDRLWTITGLLSTTAVRIESESGELVRVIPPERNQLRFALAKPVDVNEWQLGHVTLLNEGG